MSRLHVEMATVPEAAEPFAKMATQLAIENNELRHENAELKRQRRDWLDTELQAKALVEQERELIAARAELNGIKQNIALMASCNLVARMERAESERDLHKAKFDAINADFDQMEAQRDWLKQYAEGLTARIELLEADAKSGDYEALYSIAATERDSLAEQANALREALKPMTHGTFWITSDHVRAAKAALATGGK